MQKVTAAQILVSLAFLAIGFAVGVVYGGAWIGLNTKWNYCYQWAHHHRWELTQPEYMDALIWCDTWHREREW